MTGLLTLFYSVDFLQFVNYNQGSFAKSVLHAKQSRFASVVLEDVGGPPPITPHKTCSSVVPRAMQGAELKDFEGRPVSFQKAL